MPGSSAFSLKPAVPQKVARGPNAGHTPPILVRSQTGEAMFLEEGGSVIGLFPQADYTRGSAKLLQGDLLVCCTDGILKVSDENRQEYGAQRLADFVCRHHDASAQGVVDAILSEIATYATARMNDDDKLLIVMKVTEDKTHEGRNGG